MSREWGHGRNQDRVALRTILEANFVDQAIKAAVAALDEFSKEELLRIAVLLRGYAKGIPDLQQIVMALPKRRALCLATMVDHLLTAKVAESTMTRHHLWVVSRLCAEEARCPRT